MDILVPHRGPMGIVGAPRRGVKGLGGGFKGQGFGSLTDIGGGGSFLVCLLIPSWLFVFSVDLCFPG